MNIQSLITVFPSSSITEWTSHRAKGVSPSNFVASVLSFFQGVPLYVPVFAMGCRATVRTLGLFSCGRVLRRAYETTFVERGCFFSGLFSYTHSIRWSKCTYLLELLSKGQHQNTMGLFWLVSLLCKHYLSIVQCNSSCCNCLFYVCARQSSFLKFARKKNDDANSRVRVI
jgi:hypothetical protein